MSFFDPDTTLASIVGVATSSCMVLLFQYAKREMRELKEMEDSRVFSPHKLAINLEDPNFLSNTTINPQNPDEHVMKAFIEGRVRCSHPVRSSIIEKNPIITEETSDLIYRLYHREDIFSNELLESKFVFPKRLKYGSPSTQVRAPLIFNLEDEETKESCIVHRNLDVDASDVMVKIAENKEIRPLSWSDKFLIFLGVVVEAFRAVLSKNSGTKFRGLKIGFTEREFGIRVNSPLTVFGDLVYNSKDKTFRIDSPLYYIHSKTHCLKVARKKLSLSLALSIMSGIVAVGCAYYLTKKAVAYYQVMQKKKLEPKNDKLSKTKIITLENGYKCMMCHTQPRNVILKPCLHFSLCKSCLKEKQQNDCPVCHNPVEEAVDVFFS